MARSWGWTVIELGFFALVALALLFADALGAP